MEIAHSGLHFLDECAGLFLFFIALSVASCSERLRLIKLELECLHEDYDFVTDAHERAQQKRGT